MVSINLPMPAAACKMAKIFPWIWDGSSLDLAFYVVQHPPLEEAIPHCSVAELSRVNLSYHAFCDVLLK
jgi:hypothetical protein